MKPQEIKAPKFNPTHTYRRGDKFMMGGDICTVTLTEYQDKVYPKASAWIIIDFECDLSNDFKSQHSIRLPK